MKRPTMTSTAVDFVLPQWRRMEKLISIPAEGKSMFPLVRSGDRLAVRVVDPARLRTGDVFAFRRDDGVVVAHRMIGRKQENGEWFVCEKGDNLRGFNWIRQEKALGRVEQVERRSGGVLDLCAWPWPWINAVLGWSGQQGIRLSAEVRRLERRVPGVLRKRLGDRDAILYRALRKACRCRSLLTRGMMHLAVEAFYR